MSLRPPASPNPEDNPRFSAILSKARELAYPKANLEAAIQKVCIGNMTGIHNAEVCVFCRH